MRIIAWTTAISLTLFWLFADTVRHHFSPAPDGSVLRFSHFGTYRDYQTWKTLIAAFEASHPGIHIKQEYVVGWYGLYNRKLRQQFLARTEPDIALVQASSFLAMADQFAELPVRFDSDPTELDGSAMDPVALKMYRVDGQQRAMPVTGGNLLVYYNKRSFERASQAHGTPVSYPADNWTTEDFESTARLLTLDLDHDGKLDQFGFWQPRWLYYLPFLWSFGADIIDEPRQQWLLTGSEAEEAFAFYQRMRVGPTRYAPRPDEISQMIQDVGFITGRTAMCINGPWFMPFLDDTETRDDYGVAHIPTGPGGRVTRITWDGIAASKRLSPGSMKNAIAFIRFVGSSKGQRILVGSARALPARIAERTWFLEKHPRDAPRRFVEALAYSRPEPQTAHFWQIDRAVQKHLAALLRATDPIPPVEFLHALAQDPAVVSLTVETP